MQNKLQSIKKRVAELTGGLYLSTIISQGYAFATEATEALDATGSDTLDESLTGLIQLAAGLMQGAGFIVLIWGMFDFAAGYQQHDSSQQTAGLKKLLAGLLMVFAVQTVNTMIAAAGLGG